MPGVGAGISVGIGVSVGVGIGVGVLSGIGVSDGSGSIAPCCAAERIDDTFGIDAVVLVVECDVTAWTEPTAIPTAAIGTAIAAASLPLIWLSPSLRMPIHRA